MGLVAHIVISCVLIPRLPGNNGCKRVQSNGAWLTVGRDHLRRDLQPYVCTYLDCTLPDEQYYDYESWKLHEQRFHRPLWVCNDSHRHECGDRDDYIRHVLEVHSDKKATLLLPEMIDARESTHKVANRECPFCLQAGGALDQASAMQAHIARHLETVALLSLPPEKTDSRSSTASTSSQSHVAARRDRRTALSTAGDFPEMGEEPPTFHENEIDGITQSPNTGALRLTHENLDRIITEGNKQAATEIHDSISPQVERIAMWISQVASNRKSYTWQRSTGTADVDEFFDIK